MGSSRDLFTWQLHSVNGFHGNLKVFVLDFRWLLSPIFDDFSVGGVQTRLFSAGFCCGSLHLANSHISTVKTAMLRTEVRRSEPTKVSGRFLLTAAAWHPRYGDIETVDQKSADGNNSRSGFDRPIETSLQLPPGAPFAHESALNFQS